MAKITLAETAKSLLDSVRASVAQPFDMILANESEFKHLDLASYAKYGSWFEGKAFAHIADLQSPNASNGADVTHARTFSRAYASANGSIVGSYFQLKQRPELVMKVLLSWFTKRPGPGMPLACLRMLKTRHIVEFHSMLDGGAYLLTSNAPSTSANAFDTAPFLAIVRLPYDTRPKAMLQAHIMRLRELLQDDAPACVVPIETRAQLLGLWQHIHDMKREHREAVGWITPQELLKLGTEPSQVDDLYAQIQMLIAAPPVVTQSDSALIDATTSLEVSGGQPRINDDTLRVSAQVSGETAVSRASANAARILAETA